MTPEEISVYIERLQREQTESARRERERTRKYEQVQFELRMAWMRYEWEMTASMYALLAGVLQDSPKKDSR